MATSEGGDATALAITEDLYVLLEVERTASEAEIKASYRKLALKYHPDRNRGTPGAEERFKKLAQAYAILSDPNQRRFYDLSSKDGNIGGSAAFQAMQPIDVNEMNGFGRMLGYLTPLARLFCVTITIPERIDGGARYKDMIIFDTSDCVDLQTGMGGSNVKDLTIGAEVSGKVDKQEGHFFRLRITEPSECGYVVTCRSIAKNKFKLILFDQDGAVRSVQESETKAKHTSADMFLTKMEIMNMDDAWKMLSEQEQTLPEAFSRLKTLERIQTPSLEPGTHLFCVYGDNWFSSLQYTIQCLPIEHDFVESIQHVEQDLLRTKLELDAYQAEFVKAQKAYEEAMAKVDGLDRRTKGLLTTRACAYEDFFQVAALPYKHLNKKNHPEETSTFASLWSRFSVLPTPPPSNGPKRDEF